MQEQLPDRSPASPYHPSTLDTCGLGWGERSLTHTLRSPRCFLPDPRTQILVAVTPGSWSALRGQLSDPWRGDRTWSILSWLVLFPWWTHGFSDCSFHRIIHSDLQMQLLSSVHTKSVLFSTSASLDIFFSKKMTEYFPFREVLR